MPRKRDRNSEMVRLRECLRVTKVAIFDVEHKRLPVVALYSVRNTLQAILDNDRNTEETESLTPNDGGGSHESRTGELSGA